VKPSRLNLVDNARGILLAHASFSRAILLRCRCYASVKPRLRSDLPDRHCIHHEASEALLLRCNEQTNTTSKLPAERLSPLMYT